LPCPPLCCRRRAKNFLRCSTTIYNQVTNCVVNYVIGRLTRGQANSVYISYANTATVCRDVSLGGQSASRVRVELISDVARLCVSLIICWCFECSARMLYSAVEEYVERGSRDRNESIILAGSPETPTRLLMKEFRCQWAKGFMWKGMRGGRGSGDE
jgi:hypothetical protein